MKATHRMRWLDIYLCAMARTKTPRIPTCHPERKHKARGMCFYCYDKWIYHKDPESKKAKHQVWSEKNREHLKRYRLSREKLDPIKKVLYRLKHGAKKRGIPFSLTLEDLERI